MWFVYLCAFVGFLVVAGFIVFLFLPTDPGIDTIPPSKRDEEPFCPHIWQLIDLRVYNHADSYQDEESLSKIYVYQCIACNKKKDVREVIKEEFETLFVIENE